jgi:hypothetical protein
MPEIAGFSKVAPYLVNPLVLVGFCLFLFFGTHWALIKTGLLVPLSQRQSSTVIRLFLKYGFWVAILMLVLGFAYAFQNYREASHKQESQVNQQAGNCSANANGDNISQTVDCDKKDKK